MLLRDIIDLDATYGSGGFEQVPAGPVGPTPPEAGSQADGEAGNEEDAAAELAGIESDIAVEEADGEESSISLAAMEAQLKPSALATFDAIAEIHKKLHRLQDQRINALSKGEELPAGDRTPL